MVPESQPDVSRPPPPITHPVSVRCLLPLGLSDLEEPYLLTGAGDVIRAYDVSSPEDPDLITEVDAHWHDVTALRLWIRKSVAEDGKTRREPWIISTSLDGTIRKWKLSGLFIFCYSPVDIIAYSIALDLLNPPPVPSGPPVVEVKPTASNKSNSAKDEFEMTEEEERELAELMDSE